MLIRSKIERAAGFSEITIEKTTYRFAPAPEKGILAHVAYVQNKDHIHRLLGISEGYEVYLGEDDTPDLTQTGITGPSLSITDVINQGVASTTAVTDAPATVAEAISETPPPQDPETITPPEHPFPGAEASTEPVTETNPEPEPDAAGSTEPSGEPSESADDLDGMTRDELVAIYEAEAGRKPNGRASVETIAQGIRDMREEARENE